MTRLLSVFLVLHGALAVGHVGKPHVIMVLTDDLGWNTAWNNPDIHSPTLNSLAQEGVKLMSHYTYRYCSPTRAAFLTGRSPYKLLNIRENLIPTTIPESTDERFTMLPKRLQEAGYYSYQIGKWHQGFSSPSMLPVSRGFQESYGFLQGGENHYTQINGRCSWGSVTDYWAQGGEYPAAGGAIASCNVPARDRSVCPLFSVVSQNTSTSNATALCAAGSFANCAFDNSSDSATPCFQCKTKRYTGYDFAITAVNAIQTHGQKHPGQPMFMYLALHNTHGPIQAPPEFEALYNFSLKKQNTFNAMVSVVDSTVSNITAALRSSGMWDNTLLIWTTDNGSPCQVGGSNAPLRGNKGSDWEGGSRVPAFISGGLLPRGQAGKVLNGIVAIWDLFATICDLAGVDPKEINPHSPAPVDSFNMWPYLSGKVAQSPRTEIVYDHLRFEVNTTACIYAGGIQVAPCMGAGAIRVGDFKLLVGTHGYAGHYGHFSPNASWHKDYTHLTLCSMEQPCLFNVAQDMAEEHNLAVEKPGIVEDLLKRFHAYDQEYHPPSHPPADEHSGFCEAALHNGGFAAPWNIHMPRQEIEV